MTAKLPPLPEAGLDELNDSRGRKYSTDPLFGAEQMQSYARLAVRDALERASKQIEEADDGGHWYARELARIHRELMKEYRDE